MTSIQPKFPGKYTYFNFFMLKIMTNSYFGTVFVRNFNATTSEWYTPDAG